MRNRAKCKLCDDIIESVNTHDYMTCKCGEISIDGGNSSGYWRSRAANPENLIRLNDDDTVFIPKPKEIEEEAPPPAPIKKTRTRQDLLEELDEMTKHMDDLPPNALYAPLTHADLAMIINIIKLVLKAE